METKKLFRSRRDRMIGGVCGGLGEFLGIDSTLVRLIFALGIFFGFGAFFFVYIIMLLVVPEDTSELPAISARPVVSTSATENPAEPGPAGDNAPPAA
jgi:phage shock protein C